MKPRIEMYKAWSNQSSGGVDSFSGVCFGLAKLSNTSPFVCNQVAVLQKCREIFMQIIYSNITKKNVEMGCYEGQFGVYRPNIFDEEQERLLLICSSSYRIDYLAFALNNIIDCNILPLKLIYPNDRANGKNDFLIQVPPLYFKIPLLLSYTTLLIRVATYIKGNSIEEYHINCGGSYTNEAMLMSRIPVEFITKLLKNAHKIDLNKQKEVLENIYNNYGYSAACNKLGINSVLDKSDTVKQYTDFIKLQIYK